MHIWLTCDTVKRLCSVPRNIQAKQAMTYFIKMEKLYREYMLDGIEESRVMREDDDEERKRIRPLKNQFKPGHCVYVIECTARDKKGRVIYFYKIGRTKDLNDRALTHFHKLTGFKRVIYQKLCPNHGFLEFCAHAILGKLRINGEEFIEDPEKIIQVIERCMEKRNELCKEFGTCALTDEDDENNRLFYKQSEINYRKTPYNGKPILP